MNQLVRTQLMHLQHEASAQIEHFGELDNFELERASFMQIHDVDKLCLDAIQAIEHGDNDLFLSSLNGLKEHETDWVAKHVECIEDRLNAPDISDLDDVAPIHEHAQSSSITL